MDKSELNDLLKLIDDTDKTVYSAIEKRLVEYGKIVVPELEKAWVSYKSNIFKQRIEIIISKIKFNEINSELKSWISDDKDDLLKAMSIISNYRYPDIKESEITDKIIKIKTEIWLELNENLTALERIKVLNHIFFRIHKFFHSSNILGIENYFLYNLLESKSGSAVSLGILYLAISRLLEIPLFGVILDGNFILAYLKDESFSKKIEKINKTDILFYVNPANKGTVFNEKDILQYIKERGLTKKNTYFLPSDSITIIKFYLKELQNIYKRKNKDVNVEEIKKILKNFP